MEKKVDIFLIFVLNVLQVQKAISYHHVGKFIKTVTYQHTTKEASPRIAEVCKRACNYENMVAHGISCRVRLDKYGK